MSVAFQVIAVISHKTVSRSCIPQRLRSLTALVLSRGFHWQPITKNIQYVSKDKPNVKTDHKTLRLEKPLSRPLCILLSWLLSKRYNLEKYAKIYLDLGFDVAAVDCAPWQVIWPKKGVQMIAKDLLKFLEANESYAPLVVHGFSVGAYVWGETLVQAETDLDRYQPVMDRVVSQVWDSPADVDEMPEGVSYAIFPNNKLMQITLQSYLKAHLSMFFLATQHYYRATGAYHEPPCRAPTLFLVSRTDTIGTETRSRRAKALMEGIGIKCSLKCWPSSPHVMHYNRYPEEYLEALYSHFEDSGLLVKDQRQDGRVLSTSGRL